MSRTATIQRATAETRIELKLDLDSSEPGRIATGVGFLDHMLTLLSRHGGFHLAVACDGDLEVDQHHTVEDAGICLGLAFKEALGEKRGIVRYGWAAVPMDEALILVSLDLSGRAYLACDLDLQRRRIGDFDAELVPEFFRAFADNARLNLHVRQLAGENGHHIAEGAFKGLGRALAAAIRISDPGGEVPSTKGVL